MTLYLDHAATTTIRPEALAAMQVAYERFDRNASGQHSGARDAKNALEEAREHAAELLGVTRPLDVIFTGSGTEADNLAIIGGALAGDRPLLAVSGIEHNAVLDAASSLERFGYVVETLDATANGIVDVESVADLVQPAIVSVMLANNEIGTIQPVSEIAARLRERDPAVVVHTDAVQAFNSEEVTLAATGADLLSLASHKFGGPKGVGLLARRPGVPLEPLIHGGGQEGGLRSGTSNVAGVVGMVAAMEAAAADRESFARSTASERDLLEQMILAGFPAAEVTAARSPRLPHISHIRFPGILAETLLIRLDQAGVAASAGSSCHSGAVDPSHVLTAIGMDDVASGECIRFSLGWDTPEGTGARAATIVLAVVGEL